MIDERCCRSQTSGKTYRASARDGPWKEEAGERFERPTCSAISAGACMPTAGFRRHLLCR